MPQDVPALIDQLGENPMAAPHSSSPSARKISHVLDRGADGQVSTDLVQTPAPQESQYRSRLPALARHEWAAALLYVVLDSVSWISIYGIIGDFRRDKFFTGPLEFILVDLIVLGVILQALYIVGGYHRNTVMRSLTYVTEHILAIAAAAVFSSFILYSAATFDSSMKPSRGVLLLSFVVFLPISLAYRQIIGRYVSQSIASRAFLVIGSGELAAQFYDAYRRSSNRQRLEFVDPERERVGQHIAGSGSPIIEGDLTTKLANLNERYSGVVLAERVDQLRSELLERLVRTQFQRTRVYTLESFYEAHWRYVPVHSIDPVWPLQMGFQLARNSLYDYLKRLCDIVLSGALLLILWPILLLLIVVVWLDSGRPTFFRQSRVGREGNLFTAFKYRTMRVEASTDDVADIYTRAGDPRVTRTGRWLRKLRLDELPQLFNVLRGDMSLIGPRAEWIRCAERYEKKIPFYHFRHLVKPGITGWAQVNYPYGESDEDAIEKLKFDLYYIRHYSLKLDAMIILKTVHTMLFGKGR